MNEVEVAAAAAYYLFVVLGSVSAGYLAVRFTYPDVRAFSNEEKMGASALLGAFIGVLAVLADVLFSGFDAVSQTKGTWPFFWLGAGAAAFAIMFVGLRRSHAEVAVPTTKRLDALQKELAQIDRAPPGKESELKHKLDELRKKGVIPPAEEAVQPPASHKQPAPASSAPPAHAVQANLKEVRKILEQARETEVEAILRDLKLEAPSAPSETSYRHRRLYLAARKAPEPSDEQEIIQDVFAPSFKQAADAKSRRHEPPSKAGAPAKEAKAAEARPDARKDAAAKAAPSAPPQVTMSDLFGEAPAAPKAKSVFAQMQAQAEVSVVPLQQPAVCPTCHQKNSRIVFCPYCGTGMCANCSPSVVPGPDGFTYTCPHCQEEIPVKKKAA